MKSEKFWEVWKNLDFSNQNLRKIIWVLLVLLSLNYILIFKLATREEKVLVIPGAAGRMKIAPGELPEITVKSFALHLCNLFASFHPGNYDQRMNELMDYVDPRFYPELKKEQLRSAQTVKRTSFSQSFVTDSIQTRKSGNSYVVKLYGTIVKIIGDKPISTEGRVYEMRLTKTYATDERPLGLTLTYLRKVGEDSE